MILSSCERDAINVDLPETEVQIVVEGFVDPRFQLTQVFLSKTFPLRPKNKIDNNYLMTATVVISSDGVDYPLTLNSTNPSNNKFEFLSTSIPKAPGKSYKLSVKFSDGKEISSETSIPNQVIDINTLTVDKKIIPNSFGDSILQVNVSFSDLPGKSYYRIFADVNGSNLYFSNPFFDDISNEGKTINSGVGEFYFNSAMARDLNIYVINSDEHYWKYNKSIEDQFNSTGLFSEPALIPTNIKGGIGIFTSFQIIEINTTF